MTWFTNRFFSVSFWLVCWCLYALPAVAQQESGIRTVVIDAGHGGKDPGALGTLYKEKDVVLRVALDLGRKISEAYPDVSVIYTRKTDKFISLLERAEIANKAHADLFISIHCNSVEGRNATPRGAETLVMGTSKTAANLEVAKIENSVILMEEDYASRYEGFDPKSPESFILFSLYQNVYLNHSLDFAVLVQQQLKRLGRVDRGVKQAGVFVLWKTAAPSVLIELGFMTNAAEEKWMYSDAGRKALVSSIFDAFKTYKTNVDNRSHWSVTAAAGTSPEAADKTGTSAADSAVEWCVQVASSDKPLAQAESKYRNYKGISEIKVNNLYKYMAFRSSDYTQTVRALGEVRKTFRDAFITAYQDGRLIPASEALNNQKK